MKRSKTTYPTDPEAFVATNSPPEHSEPVAIRATAPAQPEPPTWPADLRAAYDLLRSFQDERPTTRNADLIRQGKLVSLSLHIRRMQAGSLAPEFDANSQAALNAGRRKAAQNLVANATI